MVSRVAFGPHLESYTDRADGNANLAGSRHAALSELELQELLPIELYVE